MQKKLIALAVAGLVSGGAFAQSNVTIYGVADVGVEFANADNDAGRQFRVQSGQSAGSRIGFKGEEALGNGLTALFQFEAGIALDNGTSTVHGDNGGQTAGVGVNGAGNNSAIFQRQAFAGLKSAQFGQVTLGRQYTPFYNVKAKTDAFALGLGGTFNNLMTVVPGNADRLNNTIAYVSPNFSGFTAGVAYSSGNENNVNTNATQSEKAGRAWGLLANYENGPVYVGFAYHDTYGANTYTTTADASGGSATAPITTTIGGISAGTDVAHSKAWILGGTYDFGVAKAFATYAQGKATQDGVSGDTAKGRLYNVGVRVPFGAHTVIGSYTKADNKLDSAKDNDAAQWGLGYEYSFSKRTVGYASYARISNDGQAAYSVNGAITQGLTTAAGKNPDSYMFGVRHSF